VLAWNFFYKRLTLLVFSDGWAGDDWIVLLWNWMQPLGRRLITGYTASLKIPSAEIEANRKKLVKFKESSWKGVYFLTAEILALLVTYDEPWFSETKYFWIGPGDRRWPDQLTK
jgi:hypothetical protein